MLRFEEIVQRSRPIQTGEHLFRAGDPFRSVAAVRVGCFKSYLIDSEGQEHVSGFSWPGEIVGLDAINSDRHNVNVMALDTSAVCGLHFRSISSLARLIPELQTEMLCRMSRQISELTIAAGDFSADERVAKFLMSVSNGFASRGYSDCEFTLPMTRKDLASYLRLASETVSRVLARFQRNGWLLIDRQRIRICDFRKLRKLAGV
jgi:CRP/FNR family transcriptional regulator